MSAAVPMTAAEYGATKVAGVHTELIAGEVIVQQPRPRHQRVLLRIIRALDGWIGDDPVRGEITLPLDVGIDDHNVFAPDLLWYAGASAPADDAPWPFALPDLAVEVRSPSTWRYDIGVKRTTYERAGLRELWLVDTANALVMVQRRSSRDVPTFDISAAVEAPDTLSSPLLPGFELSVEQLFRPQ